MLIQGIKALEDVLSPWASAYSDSTALSTTVTALHLAGMLVGGGLAIAADRATLRISHEKPGERERHLGELKAVHRPVLIALTVLFVTGLGMVASDINTFLSSPVLWVKLGLVALLVINGVVLERTEASLRRNGGPSHGPPPDHWGMLRGAAIASIALWIATLVAGTVLTSAA
jgi:hypothetical protein